MFLRVKRKCCKGLEESQIKEEKLFEVEWNHLIAGDWREDVKI